MGKHPRALDTLIALALALTVLLSRGLAADRFLSWDEPMWAYRSARFLTALKDARWGDTLVTGHPGVTTMWGGSLGLWWHSQITGDASRDQLAAAASMTHIDVHDDTQMRALGELVPLAKHGVLVLHAAMAVLSYLLLRQVLERVTAVAAALAVLGNPFLLGLSRLLHIDALAAQFMLLAIIAMLVYQRRRELLWLGVSGTATALAFATKAYAVFLAPCALLLIGLAPHRDVDASAKPAIRTVTHLFMWGSAAWLALLVIWPAAAHRPVAVIREVFGLALGYAGDPDAATSTYFLGQQTASPGLGFYPLAYLWRATPLSLVGVAAALVMLPWPALWRDKEQRRMVAALLGYGLVYTLLISLSAKKFDRYLLPAILAGDVAAGVSLTQLIAKPLGAIRARWAISYQSGALAAVAIAIQAVALAAPLAPAHYLAYYNPLAGGLPSAVETLPVGWGEGLEEAIAWLQEQPRAADLTVAAWGVPGVAPLFDGEVVPPTAANLHRADYVLVYISDVQNGEPILERFAREDPVHTTRVSGQEYVWVYANDWPQALEPYLCAMASADSVLVANDHGTLDSRWGNDTLHVILDDSDETIARRLQDLAQGCDELWYLCFDAVAPQRTQRLTRLLAIEAILLEEIPFAYGTLQRYALPTDPAFGESLPQIDLEADFGGRLRLRSGGFHRTDVEHGQAVGVTLTWAAQEVGDADLSIYLHLVDAQGRRWAQTDELLRNQARATTSAWLAESEQLSHHTIDLPAGLPPGPYEVLAGLYALAEQHSLVPMTADGRSHAGGVPLGAITVRPATHPPSPDQVAVARRLDASLGPLRLIGYRPETLQGRSGETLAVDLCWECIREMDADYQLQLVLTTGAQAAITATLPLSGAPYPGSAWQRGDVICQPYAIPLDVDLAGGQYQLVVSLLDAGSASLPEVPSVELGLAEITHIPRQMAEPETGHRVAYGFGPLCTLVGIDWNQESLSVGSPLELTLTWHSETATDTDYAVFVHLVDDGGHILAQLDAQPASGTRPTSGWLPGEYVTDRHQLTVPEDAAPGPVRVTIGLYDPATLERLPIRDLTVNRAVGDALQMPASFRIVAQSEEG